MSTYKLHLGAMLIHSLFQDKGFYVLFLSEFRSRSRDLNYLLLDLVYLSLVRSKIRLNTKCSNEPTGS